MKTHEIKRINYLNHSIIVLSDNSCLVSKHNDLLFVSDSLYKSIHSINMLLLGLA